MAGGEEVGGGGCKSPPPPQGQQPDPFLEGPPVSIHHRGRGKEGLATSIHCEKCYLHLHVNHQSFYIQKLLWTEAAGWGDRPTLPASSRPPRLVPFVSLGRRHC